MNANIYTSSTGFTADDMELQAGPSEQARSAQNVPSCTPKFKYRWMHRLHLLARSPSSEALGSRRAESRLTLGSSLEAHPPYVPSANQTAGPASSRCTPYQPLQESDEIRLVTIEFFRYSKRLSCKIERCSINSYYIAVSYTWGQLRSRHKIICNGVPLWITSNCHDLLLALQESGTDGPFWIDALCIDQQNVEERNHQVAQMGNIYNNARMTIVYLGDHTRDSLMLQQPLQRNESLGKDMVSFFSRPRFSRTWVVQEMLLSRNVVFFVGAAMVNLHYHQHLILPLDNLVKLVSDSAELSRLEVPLLAAQRQLRDGSRADEFARMLQNPTGEKLTRDQVMARQSVKATRDGMGYFTSEKTGRLTLSLSRLAETLEVTRGLQCRDPRDRVFALQSLLRRPIPKTIAVDYSRRLEDVYTDLTWFCIDYELPEVLQTCGLPDQSSNLPSWVIDWRKKPECPPLMYRIGNSGRLDSRLVPSWAAGWQSGHKQIIAKRSGSSLIIRGVVGGAVSYMTTVSRLDGRAERPTTGDLDDQLKRWLRELEFGMLPHEIALSFHGNRVGLEAVGTTSDCLFKQDISEEKWAAFKRCAELWYTDRRPERCVNRRLIILNDGLLGLRRSRH